MLVVRYKIESLTNIKSGGLAISNEQSSQGTIKKLNELNLPTYDLPNYASSKLLKVKNKKYLNKFSLPVQRRLIKNKENSVIYEGEVEIAFPDRLYGTCLETMLNSILGEVHHIAKVPIVKVLDLNFIKDLPFFLQGPKYGLPKLRKTLNVYNRPILIAPVKPSVGLSTKNFKDLARLAWEGGADIVKDDELNFYTNEDKFIKHVKTLIKEKIKIENKINKKKLYFCNLITDISNLKRRINIASNLGVDGILICPGIQGFGILPYLRNNFNGFILSHNSGLTVMTKFKDFGVSFSLFSKLQRMAGADIIVIPSPWGSFTMDEVDFKSSVSLILKSDNFWKLNPSLPAFSGGNWAGNIQKLFDIYNKYDFAIISGKGIFCHPDGPKSGAKSIRDAINLIQSGKNVKEYSNSSLELKKAFKFLY